MKKDILKLIGVCFGAGMIVGVGDALVRDVTNWLKWRGYKKKTIEKCKEQ